MPGYLSDAAEIPQEYLQALRTARREERLTEAALRRKRAEIARLIAQGQEAAADSLIASLSIAPAGEGSQTIAISERPVEARPISESLPSVRKKPSDVIADSAKQQDSAPVQRPTERAPRPVVRATKPEVLRPAKGPMSKKPSRRKWRHKSLVELGADWLGRRPPWVLSAIVHGLILATFALLTFTTLREPTLSLNASFSDDTLDEPLAEIELVDWEAPLESAAPESTAAPLELVDLLAALPELEAPSVEASNPIGDLPTETHELLSSVDSVEDPEAGQGAGSMGEQSAANGGGESKAKPGKVSFFGVQAAANRVAFVVDNSGSMQRGRMETALKELNYAVRRLTDEQQFYVLFYSDQAYPMFYPEPIYELLPATRENKKRLGKWLTKVEMCLGGRLLDGVELAATLDPELVYLLSDGDIRSQRVMQRLTEVDAWPFAIHTLGMGARNRQHAQNLVAIAESNRGVFQFVDAHPKALRRSLAKPLPYHRTPGETWGSAVQPWQ